MKKNILLKVLTTMSYVGLVAVNFLANYLPIGGVTTGEASDSFENLFTPAGYTFSIWGLIYSLLIIYVLYSWGIIGRKRPKKSEVLIEKIDKLFIINALGNASWIFAWHYGQIGVSVLIMLLILVTLIMMADLLNNRKMSLVEKIGLRLPFSVYFGWITVATIANISVFLVSINWSGWGISDKIWTVIVLFAGVLIGILRALKDRNIPYMLVFIWAYVGILFKHTSESGFAGIYPNIINVLIVSIVFFVTTIVWLLVGKKRS